MDALEVLSEAHAEARSAFQQLEQASPNERGMLWAKLRPELVIHEQYEETFVYGPVAKDAQGRDATLAGWDERHHEQVRDAEALINEIGGLQPKDTAWLDKVRRLHATLERHIHEEENDIWPRIRQVWDEGRREQAGTQVQVAKSAAGAAGTASEAVKRATERLTGD